MNLPGSLSRFADHESLQPDLGRAIRATVAFMVPLVAARAGWLTLEATFVAIAAQNIAMVDVRGAYRFRLGLLVAMTAILTGAVSLGSVSGNHLITAVLATGLMALGAGLWRHLSTDYGFSLGLSSILLFLSHSRHPEHPPTPANTRWPCWWAAPGDCCSKWPTGPSARNTPCGTPSPRAGSPWPIYLRR